ncbi:hypothetical protein [Desulfolucanica intricata]|uniref:hypothetical protein n=1 Tax=Desulfolucanica intricata TaxID=1285191 RepID=UPI00082B5B36|nr:hypothetical protein [Desulfolucanica intricata]
MKKISLILFTVIFLLTALPTMVFADSDKGKFILVIINHLTLEDLQKGNFPNINEMIAKGGLGLMNTNTAGGRSPENTYSTVANGVKSLGTDHGGYAFNAVEEVKLKPNIEPEAAKYLYTAMMGRNSTNQVLHLGMPKIIAANDNLKSEIKVGVLGTTLKANGIRIGVFGNSDGFEKSRLASLLAIDEQGQVREGIVDESILQKDLSFPFGLCTDYIQLGNEIRKKFEQLDYIVIETGDTSRLEKYKEFLTPNQYEQLRIKTLEKIDSFLGNLFEEVDWKKDQFLIISPTPPADAIKINNTVTPVIIRGKGIEAGFLSANSTRRQGIVANTDIAPTILSFWGIDAPQNIVGRPLFSIHSNNKNTLEEIKQINQQLLINYHHRTPVLKTFVVLQIIYIILAALIILFSKSTKVIKLVQKFAIVFLILPFLLLVYRFFRVDSLVITIFQLLMVLGLIYLFLSRINISFNYKIALFAMLTSIGILVDTLAGSRLVMNSPLGYDPLVGARYYGLGNEFTGVLIGSTIIGIASIFQELKRHGKRLFTFAVAYFIFLTYVLYSPSLGADAGGLIVAVISLGFFSLRLLGKRVRRKDIILLGLFTFLLLILGAFADLVFNQSRGSHIGQAFSLVIQGNWTEIGNIISRKIAMNIKLINYTIWTRVMLASLAVLGLLIYRPVGFFKRMEDANPYLKKGFEAILVAGVVGFLVNDSGIVQAATTFIYLMFPLLHLSLKDKLQNTQ